MVNLKKVVRAALKGDPALLPKMTDSLRERIDEEKGPMSTFVQAAEVLEPILAEAVRKRPSRLGKLGLKSTHLLASLAAEDDGSRGRLASLAGGTTVGIVFVDVADFTRFTAEHGDKAASKLLGGLGKIVDAAVRAGRGECVKRLGDGFLLAFPSASQAVRGAVTLRDAVRRRRSADPSFGIDLRIAVHAGEPLVDQDDLLGHDVNLTARLLDHCASDEIVVSESAKDLAERRLRKIAFGQRRVVKIRGLATKVTVYSANPGADPHVQKRPARRSGEREGGRSGAAHPKKRAAR